MVDDDERDPCRLSAEHADACDVDALVTQLLDRGAAVDIVADGANESDCCPHPGRGNRLVGALAAVVLSERAARDGFAARRQDRCRNDEIDVDRSDDENRALSSARLDQLSGPPDGSPPSSSSIDAGVEPSVSASFVAAPPEPPLPLRLTSSPSASAGCELVVAPTVMAGSTSADRSPTAPCSWNPSSAERGVPVPVHACWSGERGPFSTEGSSGGAPNSS